MAKVLQSPGIRVSIAGAVAAGTWILPVSPATADATPGTSTDPFAASTATSSSGATAATIESTGKYSLAEIQELRRAAVASLNKSATEAFGPMTAERARSYGQSDYYLDGDVAVYEVIKKGNAGTNYVSASIHDTVRPDGTVEGRATSATSALGTPSFSGPWGSETLKFATNAGVDNGGVDCNNTYYENRTKLTFRKLSDVSSSYDYYGATVSGVYEITNGADDCDDYIDAASIGLRESRSSALWAAQSPLSDQTGSCGNPVTVSVGGSFGGTANASISQSYVKCEKYDIQGGNASNASIWYNSIFDNNGSCGAESREGLLTAVVRVGQGGGFQWVLSNGIDGDNVPNSCSGC